MRVPKTEYDHEGIQQDGAFVLIRAYSTDFMSCGTDSTTPPPDIRLSNVPFEFVGDWAPRPEVEAGSPH